MDDVNAKQGQVQISPSQLAQSRRIVASLASGANPSTGEVFSPDSPYQTPDVIRALFIASRVLEDRMLEDRRLEDRRQEEKLRGDSVGRSESSPESRQESGPACQKPVSPSRSAPGNAGKPWSTEEDQRLLAGFDAGKSLADLSFAHGRTQGGVRARLEKHGRLEPSPATRWPSGKANSGRASSSHAD